jgi:erythromycin esterase-like protein
VRFVPLIAGGEAVAEADADARPRSQVDIAALIRAAAEPLPDFDDPAFGALFDRFADARVVLLGEASHGTSEFYRARAAITRRLVTRHGFTIVAAEADWPDAAVIDRHVRQRPPRAGGSPAFERFPTWMWRNTDFAAFVDWLHDHNASLPMAQRAVFHGLDLYSLGASMRAVIDYLDDVDPQAAQVARARYGCLTPWQHDPAAYGRMATGDGYRRCEQPVVAMLRDLLDRRLEYAHGEEHDPRFFDAAQNAHLVTNAERYYRSIYRGAHESWNLRDTHMFETLERLLKAGGPKSRAVVWAHNSHIGNAAFTEMGQVRDELNIGQLCRQRFGAQAMLIGFGTHAGTVAAADDWDEPMQVKTVNPSMPGSYERLAHDSGVPRFVLDLREGRHDALRRALVAPRAERFIGVIYRPDTERLSHYAQASLPGQFDAYAWFDTTTAVTPTPARARGGPDDTWPFGL